MADVVILEATGPTCFHYTFTGLGPPYLQPRMFFPGNRVNVPRAYADTMLANQPVVAGAAWVQRFDGNANEWGPPWPGSTQGTPYGAPIVGDPPPEG
jgi:hypothetical protein